MHRDHVFRLCATFTITLLVTAALTARAGDNAKCEDHTAATSSKAQPALEKLKALAGEWNFASGPNTGKLAVRYAVSAGGTSVVETLFPGSQHEMVTVYHLDGDRLMMTHYCAAGNQPRMHADPATDRLVFTYSGGSNMKDTDGHMHAMTLTFVDADHVKAEWTWKGAETKTQPFEFERKKA